MDERWMNDGTRVVGIDGLHGSFGYNLTEFRNMDLTTPLFLQVVEMCVKKQRDGADKLCSCVCLCACAHVCACVRVNRMTASRCHVTVLNEKLS